MFLNIYTDGGSRNNGAKGDAAIGYIVCDKDNKILYEKGRYIGKGTNNKAEYTALISALKIAEIYKGNNIICYSDSQLIIKQLLGEYRVKNPGLMKLFDKVKKFEEKFKSINYIHVKREHKMIVLADFLLNRALDETLKKTVLKN